MKLMHLERCIMLESLMHLLPGLVLRRLYKEHNFVACLYWSFVVRMSKTKQNKTKQNPTLWLCLFNSIYACLYCSSSRGENPQFSNRHSRSLSILILRLLRQALSRKSWRMIRAKNSNHCSITVAFSQTSTSLTVRLSPDDDDGCDSPPNKKMKNLEPDKLGDKKVENQTEVIDCEDKLYDVDLFLPPRIAVEDVQVLEEDPAIRELRLKKEELASFAKSADDIVRAVEEAARKDHVSSLHSSLEQAPEAPPKPPAERNKIVISVQNKDQRKQFRVFVDDKFERFFKMYAEKVKIEQKRLVFCFDGEKICATQTPDDLGMEDGDIIELHVK